MSKTKKNRNHSSTKIRLSAKSKNNKQNSVKKKTTYSKKQGEEKQKDKLVKTPRKQNSLQSRREKRTLKRSSKAGRFVFRRKLLFQKVASGLRDFLLIFLGTLIVFALVASYFFRVAEIKGFGMIPTLRDSDTVLVQRRGDIERFDLVCFRLGGNTSVRRVIGLPGELVRYVDDVLYVDGKEIDEKFIIDEINESQRSEGQYTEDFITADINGQNYIPDNSYLVLGDNRPYTTDSRNYGMVVQDKIIGVVKMRFLPLNDLTAFGILPDLINISK